MGRKKNALIPVGQTEDGKTLMGGIFKMCDTHGMPLTEMLDLLEQQNCMCSWLHFYEDAKKAGWKNETIESRLRESIIDVYGKPFYDRVEFVLGFWATLTQDRKDVFLKKPSEETR